jgi:hypothetical protein
MDAMVGLVIIVGLVVLATMVEVLAAMVVLAIIAERLTFSGLDALKTRERNRLRVLRTF